MYKLLALYPAPADPAHFRSYYEATHVPLAQAMPGLKACRYSFSPEGVGEASPYFCVFEGEFADKAAFEAALGSDAGQKVAADIPNYASGGVTIVHYEAKEG